MGFSRVSPGIDVPNDIHVVVEIPLRADPIKYEVDKDTGAVFVDRFMGTTMYYPCNYGYVPGTIAGDGDPVDVLVEAPFALIPGVVIRCRPVGVLHMEDESGEDAKVLAVPITKVSPLYENIHSYTDLSPLLIKQIEHFFQHYKDLEKGKWVKLLGWEGAEAAKQEIYAGVAAFQARSGASTD